MRRPAAAAHLRPHPAGAAVRRDPLPRRSVRARQGRGHLRRRAGRDGGGREPPRRRGRARADRARPRGAAGGDRSGRGPCAGRAQGAARLPGQSRRAAEHRLRRHRRRVRQGRASDQASAFACTRAAAIRSRRAASRCGSTRSTTR